MKNAAKIFGFIYLAPPPSIFLPLIPYHMMLKLSCSSEYSMRFTTNWILAKIMGEIVMDFQIIILVVIKELEVLITKVTSIMLVTQMLKEGFFIIIVIITELFNKWEARKIPSSSHTKKRVILIISKPVRRLSLIFLCEEYSLPHAFQ